MLRALPALALLALSGASTVAAAEATTVVDRVVAVVDEDPVLASDLERAIRLGLIEREAGESDAALARRALDRLIADRLRQHEVGRFGYEEVPVEEVDAQVARLAARFASREEFAAELARLALDDGALRQLLARQLAALAFVEERLGPRVFVGVDEIRRYYDGQLVPELAASGQAAPPLDEVRESIRAVLREQRLNEEIERWTEELRREADVVDLLDAPERPLPPVVRSWGETPP